MRKPPLLSFLLWIFLVGRISAQLPVAPSPEQLLAGMATAYASAQSYSDDGVVYTYQGEERQPGRTKFKTYFVRPNSFRFESRWQQPSFYPDQHPPLDVLTVLSSDGQRTQIWQGESGELVSEADVRSGVAALTGISSRAVHNVPSLLQEELRWQESLARITGAMLLGEERFEGVDCYHLRGGGGAGRTFELWLGKADFLLRKVKTNQADSWDEEIHRHLVVDAAIALGTFDLIVPQP